MRLPEKATKPTIYFIGVTTAKSSIMKIFPEWVKALGLGDVEIKGIDIEIHADQEVYRDVVEFIRNDELSYGALVTTHKIDLYNAAKNLFDYLDPYARISGELSSISKLDGRLEGHAKDPISSGLALDGFVPAGYWKEHGGEVMIMGAGGSAIAMGIHIMRKENEGNYPSKIIVTNRSTPRLEKIREIFGQLNPGGIELMFYHTPNPGDNDEVLGTLKPYSLVVNATGLGKDRPGSPLLDTCVFPVNSLVWEINYRGDLKFMHQALEQKDRRNLVVEDGWKYFVHGWTQVIAQVFHVDITGERFEMCDRIASRMR